MAEGSLLKICTCRDTAGKKLGRRCPQLRRAGGTWNSHHGKWGYQLELPKRADGSRRSPLRRYTFDGRDDAANDRSQAIALLALAGDDTALATEIADLLQQVKAGAPLPDRDTIAKRVNAGLPATADMTLGEYLPQWLESRRSIEPGTKRAYGCHIRVHLIPHLGAIPLVKLRVEHIAAMFTAITDFNTAIEIARQSADPQIRATVRGMRTTGPTTMQRIRATLRKALNDAMARTNNRLIDFNPAKHVELPSATQHKPRVWTAKAVARWHETGKKPSPVMVWTPEQAGEFLDYAQDHDIGLYPVFVGIMHRGMRRGEALGLRDTTVDLDDALATVDLQRTTDGYDPVDKKVKSESGNRTFALDSFTVAAWRAYLARRARWQLVCGSKWPNTGFFFVQPNGEKWHPDAVTKAFDRLVRDAGLPPIRLHDLRHCAATFLKASGADLTDVKELLGHSTITITSNTYTSVIVELESEREKAEAAAALVPRRRRPRAA
ncbi:site-specific integrase [Paractinoplanes toevensis]|uniref:Site-specific integrase n=1 Tax=Paractinoplanes toevensis TaxID=571911 RepID=A0A919T7A0_9ACTN|nr:site-specific integrase [Actinoplanes toevensis]GIM90163.1 site-specific integrase [Actinoplanes toevensis]